MKKNLEIICLVFLSVTTWGQGNFTRLDTSACKIEIDIAHQPNGWAKFKGDPHPFQFLNTSDHGITLGRITSDVSNNRIVHNSVSGTYQSFTPSYRNTVNTVMSRVINYDNISMNISMGVTGRRISSVSTVTFGYHNTFLPSEPESRYFTYYK